MPKKAFLLGDVKYGLRLTYPISITEMGFLLEQNHLRYQ
jgi:hypothetical protein